MYFRAFDQVAPPEENNMPYKVYTMTPEAQGILPQRIPMMDGAPHSISDILNLDRFVTVYNMLRQEFPTIPPLQYLRFSLRVPCDAIGYRRLVSPSLHQELGVNRFSYHIMSIITKALRMYEILLHAPNAHRVYHLDEENIIDDGSVHVNVLPENTTAYLESEQRPDAPYIRPVDIDEQTNATINDVSIRDSKQEVEHAMHVLMRFCRQNFDHCNGCPLHNDAEIECLLNKDYPQDWPLHL